MADTNDCCFCGAKVPSDVLTAPFSYAADEYPKRYAPVCDKCKEDCLSGKRTKEEFLEAVKPR